MFRGSPRIGPLVALLRTLPASLSKEILAVLAIGDGVVRRRRFRRALTWASAQRRGRWATLRIAIGLLANHGRFAGDEALLGMGRLQDLPRNTVIEGTERLRGLDTGAILLGFHLGPPGLWLVLRASGLNVSFAGGLGFAQEGTNREALRRDGDLIRMSKTDPVGRTQGLYRVRKLLTDGTLVNMSADGPSGSEAFRVDLPGGPLIVRSGWLALRRQVGVPVFPVLNHIDGRRRDGRRRVIVIHPPLPPVDGDVARDVEMCRQTLTPLLQEYVRRFPTQCRYLVFPSWRQA
jgi:lauroyl/myristoyl acyltransferase